MLAKAPRLMAKSEKYVVKLMESVSVIKVAIGVKRVELMSLHQDRNESFRTFATHVRRKAETCNFRTVSECECRTKNLTSYTEEAIKDLMLVGVADYDIRRVVLSTEDIVSRSSFDIISFIESTEMGRYATENSCTVSAVSSFQRQEKQCFNVGDKSQYVSCQCCKKLVYPFKEKGTWNVKLSRYCLSCWCSQSKKVNAVQTQYDSFCFMQQDT